MPADLNSLEGVGVLIVGASSGVGRSLAIQAVGAGARVVLAGRRLERLKEVVDAAGGGFACPVDVTDADACARLAAACVAELGQVDLAVNVTAMNLLRRIIDTDAADWSAVLGTNVVGCNTLIRAVLGTLSAHAIVATLSSEDVARPRTGLGAYTASKAALEASIAAWRGECAPIRFACIAIGATTPTSISDGFDRDLLAEILPIWIGSGRLQKQTMATDDVANGVLAILSTVLKLPGINLEHTILRSPSATLLPGS